MSVAVYDGQRWLGSVTEDDGGRYLARDEFGCKVGTFDTVKEAADALSRKDAKRQRRQAAHGK